MPRRDTLHVVWSPDGNFRYQTSSGCSGTGMYDDAERAAKNLLDLRFRYPGATFHLGTLVADEDVSTTAKMLRYLQRQMGDALEARNFDKLCAVRAQIGAVAQSLEDAAILAEPYTDETTPYRTFLATEEVGA